jgi:DeoR family suf operon transcriptional repressor
MKSKEKTSTKQDILQYLLKHGTAIAHELAEHLDISVQAIRRHLKDLEHEGLVVYHVAHPDESHSEQHDSSGNHSQPDRPIDNPDISSNPSKITNTKITNIINASHVGDVDRNLNRVGSSSINSQPDRNSDLEPASQSPEPHAVMGRPQHVYELSKAGRDRFPANYDQFSVSLLDTLAETFGNEQVSEILHKQWLRKAVEYRQKLGDGSLRDRVAQLTELRRSEGYVAEWFEQEPNQQGNSSYILTEYNCAISEVAESFPSVCSHELEMFEAALEGCKVERTHWMVDGEHRCGYLISSNSN